MAEAIMNYDPNMVLCGRMAKQTVRLTFGIWEYRCTKEVVVGGNCTGLQVIETAVESLYDKLPEDEWGVKFITMESEKENHENSDEEERGEEWLKDMLIAAEIITIEPYGRE